MYVLSCWLAVLHLIFIKHSKRKRIFAERYAMTNILKAETLAAIQERAMAFVSLCSAAGRKSVDVYVFNPFCTQLDIC